MVVLRRRLSCREQWRLGVTHLLVSYDGVVYQKNLGKSTRNRHSVCGFSTRVQAGRKRNDPTDRPLRQQQLAAGLQNLIDQL